MTGSRRFVVLSLLLFVGCVKLFRTISYYILLFSFVCSSLVFLISAGLLLIFFLAGSKQGAKPPSLGPPTHTHALIGLPPEFDSSCTDFCLHTQDPRFLFLLLSTHRMASIRMHVLPRLSFSSFSLCFLFDKVFAPHSITRSLSSLLPPSKAHAHDERFHIPCDRPPVGSSASPAFLLEKTAGAIWC